MAKIYPLILSMFSVMSFEKNFVWSKVCCQCVPKWVFDFFPLAFDAPNFDYVGMYGMGQSYTLIIEKVSSQLYLSADSNNEVFQKVPLSNFILNSFRLQPHIPLST